MSFAGEQLRQQISKDLIGYMKVTEIEKVQPTISEFVYPKRGIDLVNEGKIIENSSYLNRVFLEAIATNVTVIIEPNAGLKDFSSKGKGGVLKQPAIRIGPISSRNTFLAAMHELGHCNGKWQDHKENTILEMEAGAWLWAREHIYDWTEEDGIFRRFCLASYVSTLERNSLFMDDPGYRLGGMRLFPKPKPNHIIWDMMNSNMV